MLKNNLSTLLGERKLKITRVSKDTGISRTTLTALAQNDEKGIQLETLNTLFRYLDIEPNDFFDFNAFDYSFDVYVENVKFSLDKAKDNYCKYKLEHLELSIYLDVSIYSNQEEQIKRYEIVCLLENVVEFEVIEMPFIELKHTDVTQSRKIELQLKSNEYSVFEDFMYAKMSVGSQQIFRKTLNQGISFALLDNEDFIMRLNNHFLFELDISTHSAFKSLNT